MYLWVPRTDRRRFVLASRRIQLSSSSEQTPRDLAHPDYSPRRRSLRSRNGSHRVGESPQCVLSNIVGEINIGRTGSTGVGQGERLWTPRTCTTNEKRQKGRCRWRDLRETWWVQNHTTSESGLSPAFPSNQVPSYPHRGGADKQGVYVFDGRWDRNSQPSWKFYRLLL